MQLKLSTVSSLLAAATIVGAQIIGPANWSLPLPPCAQPCALQAAAQAGCAIADTTCLCNSPTFYNDFVHCISTNCPITNIQTSKDLVKRVCTQVDWLWGVNPCVRGCAIWAASQIPCDINDHACLCLNRDLFLYLVRQCVLDRGCPVLSSSAGVIQLPFTLPCAVIDPTIIQPTPTLIAV